MASFSKATSKAASIPCRSKLEAMGARVLLHEAKELACVLTAQLIRSRGQEVMGSQSQIQILVVVVVVFVMVVDEEIAMVEVESS